MHLKIKNNGLYRNTMKSSTQQCKIYNLWHPIKNHHQAWKEEGQYDPYSREKLINRNRHGNER